MSINCKIMQLSFVCYFSAFYAKMTGYFLENFYHTEKNILNLQLKVLKKANPGSGNDIHFTSLF